MPTISLRLTEEEHAALKRWAYEGQRSVQREIIFRLFSDNGELERARPARAATTEAYPHFKPDPK